MSLKQYFDALRNGTSEKSLDLMTLVRNGQYRIPLVMAEIMFKVGPFFAYFIYKLFENGSAEGLFDFNM